MAIFAIGDVHGCADELDELLGMLPLKDDSTVVMLGDYIDRGPYSRRVIETLIAWKKKQNFVTLSGNHEEMLREFLDERITWDEYVPRYRAGLRRPEAQAAIAEVRRRAREGRVTLLCGCADEQRCHRSLLRAYLLNSPRARPRSARPRAAERPARRRRA